MAVKYYSDRPNEPIPDGRYILIFKDHPWPQSKEDKKYPLEHPLHFKDYSHFTWDKELGLFKAYHREGDYVEIYPLSNILYIELKKNSREVAEALRRYYAKEANNDYS